MAVDASPRVRLAVLFWRTLQGIAIVFGVLLLIASVSLLRERSLGPGGFGVAIGCLVIFLATRVSWYRRIGVRVSTARTSFSTRVKVAYHRAVQRRAAWSKDRGQRAKERDLARHQQKEAAKSSRVPFGLRYKAWYLHQAQRTERRVGIPVSATWEEARASWRKRNAAVFGPSRERSQSRRYKAQFKGAFWCVLCQRNVYPRSPLTPLGIATVGLLSPRRACPVCGGIRFLPARIDPDPGLGVSK